MMKKGKKFNVFSEPILHLIITLLGLGLIIFLPDSDSVCGVYKKIVSISTDIGIGLFPTGLIGLILVFMQKNEENNEKFTQRISLMKEIDIKLHNHLNEICRISDSFLVSSNLVLKKVLLEIQNTNISIPIDNNIKNSADYLSLEIKSFLSNKTDYLLNETFSDDELEAFCLLAESIDTFSNEYIEGVDAQTARNFKHSVACILRLLEKFSEFKPYLKTRYSGSHIQ